MGLYSVSIIIFILSLIVQFILKSRIEYFSRSYLSSGKTGAEIAEQMLNDNGIYDVKIVSTDGFLTDYYNPVDRTVNLSPNTYNGSNVTAIAVAAHECGHAVQHARGYAFLQLRSAMVPMLTISSKYMMWIIFLGIMMIRTSLVPLQIGIGLFALTTLFSFITLPVEFNASSRALSWIKNNRVLDFREYRQANEALTWAAMTYVLAAIGSLAELLRLISILNNNRRND